MKKFLKIIVSFVILQLLYIFKNRNKSKSKTFGGRRKNG